MTNKSPKRSLGLFSAADAKKEASFDPKWDKIKVNSKIDMKKKGNLNRFIAEEAAESLYADEHYAADYNDEYEEEMLDESVSIRPR